MPTGRPPMQNTRGPPPGLPQQAPPPPGTYVPGRTPTMYIILKINNMMSHPNTCSEKNYKVKQSSTITNKVFFLIEELKSN